MWSINGFACLVIQVQLHDIVIRKLHHKPCPRTQLFKSNWIPSVKPFNKFKTSQNANVARANLLQWRLIESQCHIYIYIVLYLYHVYQLQHKVVRSVMMLLSCKFTKLITLESNWNQGVLLFSLHVFVCCCMSSDQSGEMTTGRSQRKCCVAMHEEQILGEDITRVAQRENSLFVILRYLIKISSITAPSHRIPLKLVFVALFV